MGGSSAGYTNNRNDANSLLKKGNSLYGYQTEGQEKEYMAVSDFPVHRLREPLRLFLAQHQPDAPTEHPGDCDGIRVPYRRRTRTDLSDQIGKQSGLPGTDRERRRTSSRSERFIKSSAFLEARALAILSQALFLLTKKHKRC